MLSPFQSILLGVIQGTTEWLPVSSSGHLVLAQKFLNLEVPVAFGVFLHLATLIVIFDCNSRNSWRINFEAP